MAFFDYLRHCLSIVGEIELYVPDRTAKPSNYPDYTAIDEALAREARREFVAPPLTPMPAES